MACVLSEYCCDFSGCRGRQPLQPHDSNRACRGRHPRRPVVRFSSNLRILRVGERIALPLFIFAKSSVFGGMAPSPRELSSVSETEGVLNLTRNSFHHPSKIPLTPQYKNPPDLHCFGRIVCLFYYKRILNTIFLTLISFSAHWQGA